MFHGTGSYSDSLKVFRRLNQEDRINPARTQFSSSPGTGGTFGVARM